MIKFRGEISDEVMKQILHNRSRLEQLFYACGLLVLLPFVVYVTIKVPGWFPVVTYGIAAVLYFLLPYLPQTAKYKETITPQEIYIDGTDLVCVTKSHTETRDIKDVKTVFDCGDYYNFSFIFGHHSFLFVCQKNLLVNGSFEKFEKIFEGKIIRKL